MAGKKHWYAFSYIGNAIKGNAECQVSTYTGYYDKKVTLKRINENKEYAGVTSQAVLISCVYCGYMTQQDFEEA